MKHPLLWRYISLFFVAASLLIAGCGGSSSNAVSAPKATDDATPLTDTDDVDKFTKGRTFTVSPGPNATKEMVDAMIQLKPGDTLEFKCGFLIWTKG